MKPQKTHLPKKRGFTLIELMVVIAIIGILAGIVMVSLSAAKGRGNDTKRKSDLKNLALSLSQYYSDNGSYPSTGGHYNSNTPTYIPNLAPTYTNSANLPMDPQPDTTKDVYGYMYISDGQSYKLFDINPLNSAVASTPTNDEFYDPVNPTKAWMVCSGATACNTW